MLVNTRIPAQAEALARRLAILDAVTTALGESLELDALLLRALDLALEITGVDGGGIFLFDEDSRDLRLMVHRGVSSATAAGFAANPGPTLRAIAADPTAASIVRDISTIDLRRPELEAEGIQAFAAIPLHIQGQVLGVLAAISHTTSDFNASDVDLLVSVGKQVGLAIERARLMERERRRARQLETISEVGRRLGAIHTERELLPRVVHYVREHLGYESANLLVLDDYGRELVLVAGSGLGNEDLIGSAIPADARRSMAGWVLANNQPLLANDVSREPRHFPAGGMEQAELVVPIHTAGRVLGVLDVQSAHTNAFHEIDVSVLQILAGQIAVALENARLHESAQRSLRRMQALQDVATVITASLDLPTILDQALAAAMDVFGADRAAMFLVHPRAQRMEVAASRGLSTGYLTAVQEYYASREWSDSLDQERSIYVENAQTAPLVPELAGASQAEGIRSMLILPLPNDGVRWGNFVLYHDRIRHYSNDEIDLARTFADQANVAIQHARVFEAERRARDQASTILEATRSIASSLRYEDVLAEAAACIAAALGQKSCSVWMLNEQRTELVPTYRYAGRPDKRLDEIFLSMPPIPLAGSPRHLRLVETGEPFINDSVDQLSDAERKAYDVFSFTSYVAVPLAVRDKVIGAAAVPFTHRGRSIGPDDVEVAMAIARSTALALENARLYEQSQQLAISEERNRLARELHDSVTHSLFSMTLIAQALPRLLDLDETRARERIDRLGELGRGALAEMRALIFQLRPTALQEQGLADALEKYTAAFESRESVKVRLDVEGARRLPLPIEEALLRVAQEALNNVAKHAHATSVDVSLTVTATLAVLTITDDGQGFNPVTRQSAGQRSLGMTSMQERAALVGGVCTVDSAPGQGATVEMRVPVGT